MASFFSSVFSFLFGSSNNTPVIKPEVLMITTDQLTNILPKETTVNVQEFCNALNTIPQKYGIDTKERFIMFLSQTAYESNYFAELEEDLNYSAKRLLQVWPKRFTEQTAEEYANNPEKLANYVYANRMGNGSPETGDGWKYRGRGIIQLTGKDNYANFANAIGKSLDEIVNYCDTITGATESACWFWKAKGLEKFSTIDNVEEVTRIINGGLLGLTTRKYMFTRVSIALN